jgi:DNA invertase Pin-like site-specific DNA recombinase
MRTGPALLLVIALVGASPAMPAAAQEQSGQAGQAQRSPPTELWDEFPLEQPPPESSRESAPQGDSAPGRGEPRKADDTSTAVLPLGLAVIGALVLAAGAAFFLRRRARPTAAAVALPSEGGGPTPGAEAARPRARAEPRPPAHAATGDQAAPTHPHAATELGAAPVAATTSAEAAAHRLPASATGATSNGGGETPAAPPAGVRPRVPTARALGYASVSGADGQAGDELKHQIRLIQEGCQSRGLELVKIVRDIESHAGSDLRRPGLTYALDRLAARDAECLVVTSLERLTRTASHLGTILGWLNECDARLVILDLDLDTGTHGGQISAKALATVGGLERKKLEERTRKGLEAARSTRRSGRPAVSDQPSLKQRIAEMRAQGMTLQAIADTLNAEGVPTLRGGAEWRPSSVQAAAGYKRPSRQDRLRRARRRDERPKAK